MITDLTTKVDHDLMKIWLDQQENKHIAMGHIGTHLDTYLKSQIPLEYFKRRAILVDSSDFAEKREIGLNDIEGLDIREGDFVLFKTNRSRITYGKAEYFKDHPILSKDLIKKLISIKISFIGIDSPGIRRGEEHRIADILCEENQVYVIENLSNLDKLTKGQLTAYTMWLEDPMATGLRCKVICQEN